MITKSRLLGIFLLFLLLGFVSLVALFIMAIMGEWSYEAVWAFFTGWVTYPARILPRITYNWEMIFCGLTALALAMYLAHRFLRWLASHVPAIPSPWNFRKTAILSFLLLSMFGTSIAMTGIIHQSAWLASAPELLRTRGMSISVMQESEARSLFDALLSTLEVEAENARFPNSLVLPDDKEAGIRSFNDHLCSYGKGHSEPWLYPGAGKNLLEERFPVLISPRPNREGRIVVAYSNFQSESYPFDDLPPEIAEFFR